MYKLRNNHYVEHVDNQIIVQSCMRFTPRIMCWWGRSSRRCDHQLDPRAEPRLLEAPCTLPCALQCAFLLPFLLPEAAPRTQTGNKTVVLSLSEWVVPDCPRLRPMQQTLRFLASGCRDLFILQPLKTSLYVNPLAYEICHLLIWTGLPLSSVSCYPLLMGGPVSNYHIPGKFPARAITQHTLQ